MKNEGLEIEVLRSLMVGLNFDEVKGLFLAKGGTWILVTWPIGHGQFCIWTFRPEDFPMIGDPDRDLGLRGGGLHFVE